MNFLTWAVRTFRLAQFDDFSTWSGQRNPNRPSESSERPPIVGGYYSRYRPGQPGAPFPADSGFYGPQGDNPVRFTPYRENDMTRILNRIATSGAIYDMQLALIRAGFLDDDVNDLGWIGSDTESAFADLLAVANQHGMRWEDVLSQAEPGAFLSGSGGSGGGSGGGLGSGGVTITLPNRDDLVASVDDLALSQYGQRVDQDLQETIADRVLDALRTQQEREVQREMAAGGGVNFTESAPDPARLLDEEIRQRRPGMVMEKGVRDAMDSWFEALAGPV